MTLNWRTLVLIAGLVGVPHMASATSIIEIKGTTAGCFTAGCAVYTSPVINVPKDLTFTGVIPFFDEPTDGSGALASLTLGTLTRGSVNFSKNGGESLGFGLNLTFTLPSGATGVTSFAALILNNTNGNGGNVDVDFTDNSWHLITYSNASGSGSFEIKVNDLLVVSGVGGVPKGGSANITGAIQNATFTPVVVEQVPTTPNPVPEPASLLLLGGGLVTVAAKVRRRRKS